MRRRTIAFALLGFALALLFVRLGVWQLSRLGERRARNAITRDRLSANPVPIDSLPSDSSAHYRRVSVTGSYDYVREMVLVARSRNGSPGVNLLTPMRLPGGKSVLVNRGWVYSPDGQRVENARWREADTASITGWIQMFEPARGDPGFASQPNALRWMDHDAASERAGTTLPAYYVVASPAPGEDSSRVPVRLPAPPLDEGPHLSYAIQWFSFATIAVLGVGTVAARERREDRAARADSR